MRSLERHLTLLCVPLSRQHHQQTPPLFESFQNTDNEPRAYPAGDLKMRIRSIYLARQCLCSWLNRFLSAASWLTATSWPPADTAGRAKPPALTLSTCNLEHTHTRTPRCAIGANPKLHGAHQHQPALLHLSRMTPSYH